MDQVIEQFSSRSAKLEHFVRFYDDDEILMEEVADFLNTALHARGTGILIATKDHVDSIIHRLVELQNEPNDKHWILTKLISFDAQETLNQFMVDDWPDDRLFNLVVGQVVRSACAEGLPVNAFGEMVAILCAQGLVDAAVHLEHLWNGLADETAFSLFCAYPWKQFPSAESSIVFKRICEAHDHVCNHGKQITIPLKPDPIPARDANLKLAELEQKSRALKVEVARRNEAEHAVTMREQDLVDFMENSAEGLHQVGTDGVILWANKAELNMLGYQPNEYIGHHIADFHVDQSVIDDILFRLAAGETIYDYPARLKCKDGSIKHVLLHSNAYFENGQLRYTRCSTRDATDRHQRDEAFAERERLLAELTNANQAKDEFLAMLGHELRNPLAPIMMVLDLMSMRDDAAHKKERGVIERQIAHMTRLVDDLLDISRITRGRMELQVSEIDVSQTLKKAIEMASPLFEQRNHKLHIDIEQNLHIHGDPVRVAQAVANVLNNAARYTEKGGEILLSANSENGEWLRISVKDNGNGISASMLEQIFEMFFQSKQKIDRAQGGLGIGLSIVKNIVKLHGGTVEAKSLGIGYGSEFILRIPIASKVINISDSALAHEHTLTLTKHRIMIVDDNVDALDILGNLLEAHGHEVELFDNPITALSEIDRFEPEIAILDIGLPGLSGYELAEKIKLNMGNKVCRLIALTGYGQESDRAKSLAAGFEKHFVKPVVFDNLIDFIQAKEK